MKEKLFKTLARIYNAGLSIPPTSCKGCIFGRGAARGANGSDRDQISYLPHLYLLPTFKYR